MWNQHRAIIISDFNIAPNNMHSRDAEYSKLEKISYIFKRFVN